MGCSTPLQVQKLSRAAVLLLIFSFESNTFRSDARRCASLRKVLSEVLTSTSCFRLLYPLVPADEVEYLITARKWDYLKGFLGVFASCEQDFVELIEGMFPSSRPAAVSARDAMQLEAQNIYLAVDDLYQVRAHGCLRMVWEEVQGRSVPLEPGHIRLPFGLTLQLHANSCISKM